MKLNKIIAVAIPILFVSKQILLSMDAEVSETGTVVFSYWFWISVLAVELVILSLAVYILWNVN